METLNTEIRNKILEFLKTTKIGASSSEISKAIGHNRVTVSKYLEIMRAHKLLGYEGVAQAKLWYITKKSDRPTILIVDDEPHIVELVCLSLIPDKYHLIKAYSGLDALDKVSKESPDLIVLDLMMPGTSGHDVCRKVKENALTQHIPIIILSAKGEIDDKLKGLRIGADDYITKPFDPMELEARVERLIRRTSQDQDLHPLSKLPGKKAIHDHLRRLLLSHAVFTVHNVTINNFSRYCTRYGYTRADHVLTLMSRIFTDAMNHDGDTYVGHTVKDHFVIITRGGAFLPKVTDSFARMQPYLSTDRKSDLTLDIKTLTSTEIQKSAISPDNVMAALGVH
jgi:two-component system, OmpR family, alkaline phosphatase synthesis response regulator PhoP